MRTIAIAIAFALAAATPAAAAPPLENLDALDARVAQALGGADAQPIDRRMRLLQCPDMPVIDAPALGTVSVHCAARGWSLRVPLLGTAQAAQTVGDVVVRRGDSLELVYGGAGFSLVTSGTALEDGRASAVIRVKSTTGAATVMARVRSAGAAEIVD